MEKAKVFKVLDAIVFNIKEMQADTQRKLDALVIHEYVNPMIEVRRLCNEHREEMGCNILI